MSNSSQKPWSDGPNAPQIITLVYLKEKADFAGACVGAVLYGIVIVLFFQCMGALLDPVKRIRGSIKWTLVAHTVAMFLFLTVHAAMILYYLSDWHIDGRNYPGDNKGNPPGPVGYSTIVPKTYVPYALMFPLNQWLADGLLLHRCYVIYSMNNWVMVFPCLMFVASVATSLTYVYQTSRPKIDLKFGTAYLSISLSLSILLTLMIVTRLILHRRNIRKAIGTSGGASGLYTAVVTILVESYALYAAAFLAYVVPWSINSYVAAAVSKLVGPIQVIAPYLIIIRVAKQRALTDDMISGTANVGSIRFGSKSQETTDSDRAFSGGDLTSSTEVNSEVACEFGAGAENAVEGVPS